MSDNVREYRLRSALGTPPRAFYGVQLAEVTTEADWRPRWIEMNLFRRHEVVLDDDGHAVLPLQSAGKRQWVLQVIGRTMVYHTHHSACGAGVVTRAAQLDDDAEPCERCRPPELDDLDDDMLVDAEVDRFTVHVCETPQQIIARLGDPRSQQPAERLSGPAQALLEQAMNRDEEVAAALNVVQWLTG